MSTTTRFTPSAPSVHSATGRLFLVSGLAAGREIFLGRAIDEGAADQLTLEGKVLSIRPQGRLVVRPFTTVIDVPLREPTVSVQRIAHPRAQEEALGLLALAATHASRSAYPFLVRWVETALEPPAGDPDADQDAAPVGVDPFLHLYEGFLATAEEFRRVLIRARQVETTRELDQVSELEGDLLIEIGKVTNQAALKLNQILERERDLGEYIEAFAGPDRPPRRVGTTTAGWPYLYGRLSAAKVWARRNGKADLVREINALSKDGVFALNEVLLDHGNSLDTLITESFGQYGLVVELPGEPHGEEPRHAAGGVLAGLGGLPRAGRPVPLHP